MVERKVADHLDSILGQCRQAATDASLSKGRLAELIKNNSQVKKVAEWAGRFKVIARKKQKSKHVFSVERDGIIRGDNPELLLPIELAMEDTTIGRVNGKLVLTRHSTKPY